MKTPAKKQNYTIPLFKSPLRGEPTVFRPLGEKLGGLQRNLGGLLIFLLLCVGFISAQQTAIPRIDMMPNLPAPYLMRDWKQVAVDYDNFVFDTAKTGLHLPLTKINTSNGVNYPGVKNIRMDTYVGQANHGNVAEAINILPAIVGASLVGVDKTNHFNTNWVTKAKDFFNLKNGQLVYLNSYSAGTGSDWWYEVMPNVFFYQLYALYPNADADFAMQFSTIANRQLKVLFQLGGTIQPWKAPNMNFRAFNLITGLPNATSVPEPETAGSIAWLLYQAYVQSGDAMYLQGAELALDFLQNWTSNPSYEIQLPYGIAAAARMNAVEGTNYDLLKMLNWTFSPGRNTLRGWGTIVGKWNGFDVSGLIGEANDAGNDYAFSMNGFQHAAALAPVAKYDKRFARAIGKWMLNVANASRLFYNNGLPQANQHPAGYAWATQYDPQACIPFEAIKENFNGTRPLAMGDAVKGGWAATDLSLYSGSSVGYLASIISKTNVEGILQIDLNKTDFRGDTSYPVYLYYNPTAASQSVQITLPTGNQNVYDAITGTVLNSNVAGTISFSIPADSVRQLVVYPAGKTPMVEGRLMLVDNHIIDYHVNYNYTNPLRIKAFSVSDTIVQKLSPLTLYCLPENNSTSNLSFQWLQDDALLATTATGNYSWTAPATPATYRLQCRVSENGDTAVSHVVAVRVEERLVPAPVISDIIFPGNMPFGLNATITPSATVNNAEATYSWSATGGTLANNLTATPTWTLPNSAGIYSVSLTATNTTGSATFTKPVLVKDLSQTDEPTPLIYYPLNGDTKNKASDAFHAVSVDAVSTIGANDVPNGAYRFQSAAAYIYTPNEAGLNFSNQISISLWVKPDALPNNEQFIISHGSWEERFKISVTPEKKLRWTVKTALSTVDVDADTVLVSGKFDHFTGVYTGYSLELYRNGKLSGFKPQSGLIQTTAKSLTIARKDEGTSEYNFRGTVDEVRIYDREISQYLTGLLPNTFSLKAGMDDTIAIPFRVYPNPFSTEFNLQLPAGETASTINIYDVIGKLVYSTTEITSMLRPDIPSGFYLLLIKTQSGNHYKAKLIKRMVY